MKVKIEEAKAIEEVLKHQLRQRERIQEELEIEIYSLKKQLVENQHQQKYEKSSSILDQILNNQRPTTDKFGL